MPARGRASRGSGTYKLVHYRCQIGPLPMGGLYWFTARGGDLYWFTARGGGLYCMVYSTWGWSVLVYRTWGRSVLVLKYILDTFMEDAN